MLRRLAYGFAVLAVLLAVAAGATHMGESSAASAGPPIALSLPSPQPPLPWLGEEAGVKAV
jgi:hypothetical protein